MTKLFQASLEFLLLLFHLGLQFIHFGLQIDDSDLQGLPPVPLLVVVFASLPLVLAHASVKLIQYAVWVLGVDLGRLQVRVAQRPHDPDHLELEGELEFALPALQGRAPLGAADLRAARLDRCLGAAEGLVLLPALACAGGGAGADSALQLFQHNINIKFSTTSPRNRPGNSPHPSNSDLALSICTQLLQQSLVPLDDVLFFTQALTLLIRHCLQHIFDALYMADVPVDVDLLGQPLRKHRLQQVEELPQMRLILGEVLQPYLHQLELLAAQHPVKKLLLHVVQQHLQAEVAEIEEVRTKTLEVHLLVVEADHLIPDFGFLGDQDVVEPAQNIPLRLLLLCFEVDHQHFVDNLAIVNVGSLGQRFRLRQSLHDVQGRLQCGRHPHPPVQKIGYFGLHGDAETQVQVMLAGHLDCIVGLIAGVMLDQVQDDGPEPVAQAVDLEGEFEQSLGHFSAQSQIEGALLYVVVPVCHEVLDHRADLAERHCLLFLQAVQVEHKVRNVELLDLPQLQTQQVPILTELLPGFPFDPSPGHALHKPVEKPPSLQLIHRYTFVHEHEVENMGGVQEIVDGVLNAGEYGEGVELLQEERVHGGVEVGDELGQGLVRLAAVLGLLLLLEGQAHVLDGLGALAAADLVLELVHLQMELHERVYNYSLILTRRIYYPLAVQYGPAIIDLALFQNHNIIILSIDMAPVLLLLCLLLAVRGQPPELAHQAEAELALAHSDDGSDVGRFKAIVLEENLRIINEVNSDSSKTYKLEANAFASMTKQQIKQRYFSLIPSNSASLILAKTVAKPTLKAQTQQPKPQTPKPQTPKPANLAQVVRLMKSAADKNVSSSDDASLVQKQVLKNVRRYLRNKRLSSSVIENKIIKQFKFQGDLHNLRIKDCQKAKGRLLEAQTAVPPDAIIQDVDWSCLSGRIKSQGDCGACYAFATVDAMAALLAIYHYTFFIDLSVQYVVDCTKNSLVFGCNGGFLEGAYAQMMDPGIHTAYTYPYYANSLLPNQQVSCRKVSERIPKFTIESFETVRRGDCEDLRYRVQKQPISVGIAGYKLAFYREGVFNGCDEEDELDHAALLVGYKRGKGWKIKNSWGTRWGEGGYAWIAEGNTCKICEIAFYPVPTAELGHAYYAAGKKQRTCPLS